MSLLLGAATADITPPAGVAMGGYGARTGVATGVQDPLLVRAVVLSNGSASLALAVCDLVGVSRHLVEPAREQIERDLGIPADHVLVAATHTHSGPASLRADDDPDYVRVAARTIAGAVRTAAARAEPVSLRIGKATVDGVSQNRRHPEGPTVADATVMLAVAAGPPGRRRPVATVVGYACHATVLEHDNLLFSADFPGATNRLLERELGGTAVYLQGPCGDVNPVWLAHDADEVERIGGIVGAAALGVARQLQAVGEDQRVVNLSWGEDLSVPARGQPVDGGSLAGARRVVEVPWRVLGEPEAIAARVADLEAELARAPARRRELFPSLHRARMERLFSQWAPQTAGRTHKAEVQVLRLSEQVAIVGLPGEFFVDVGRDIAARSPFPETLVCCYANNYLGYFPTAAAFAEDGYEVGCARFTPEAAGVVADAAVALLSSLC